jgi:hypothetical protein
MANATQSSNQHHRLQQHDYEAFCVYAKTEYFHHVRYLLKYPFIYKFYFKITLRSS